MTNRPENVSQNPDNSRQSLLSPASPELQSSQISRRRALLLGGGFLLGGGLALSRQDIVWAGKSKNRTGSGDTTEEKAKRRAKKGHEGRGSKKNIDSSAKGSERCAQGLVNIYNPTTGQTATLPDSCADLPPRWSKGTPAGKSR